MKYQIKLYLLFLLVIFGITFGLAACGNPLEKEEKTKEETENEKNADELSNRTVITVNDDVDAESEKEDSEIPVEITDDSYNISDLMVFYGANIKEVLKSFPNIEHKIESDEDSYLETEERGFDGLSLAGPIFNVDANGIVTRITYGGIRYSIANVKPGIDFKEASNILNNNGWRFEDSGFTHGDATYYAVYARDDIEIGVFTDGTGDFRVLEEEDITGSVDRITVYRHEEEPEPVHVDVFEYLTNYKDLVKQLDMIPFFESNIQLGDAYESYQFFLEYDEYGDFSMTNEASPYVSLCDISIGDSAEIISGKMKEYGFKEFFDRDDMAIYSYLKGDTLYEAIFYKEFGVVTRWYLNNWPEGEDAYDMWEQWE